jgi:DNA-binding response OmpR family regulator/CO dehydrogenase nickel-insertion accessory protein CooC1
MLDYIQYSKGYTMAEKILIIDDDVDTLKLVGLMLQKQGYQIVAANNGERGLTQAETEKPDLILLDIMMPEMDGYEVAKRLRANQLTASIPILMFTAKTQLDDKVSGFEAGADDYLTKPTRPTELSAHVKALLSRTSKVSITPPVAPTEFRSVTIGILAPRGGQGVTTTAVNLGDALRLETKADVIVAELRPGMGSLGPDMGETNPKVLTEFLSINPSELTRQRIKEKLFVHSTGLRLLFGSVNPKDGLLLNVVGPMEALVNQLSYLAQYLVLDLGSGLTLLTQKLIPACKYILVVVEPVINSVNHSKALMADLADIGGNKQNIHAVVVNRIRSDTQLNMAQMEELLGQTPLVAVTPAPELLYTSTRMKTTAVATRPDSLTAQQFTKLAQEIVKLENPSK